MLQNGDVENECCRHGKTGMGIKTYNRDKKLDIPIIVYKSAAFS